MFVVKKNRCGQPAWLTLNSQQILFGHCSPQNRLLKVCSYKDYCFLLHIIIEYGQLLLFFIFYSRKDEPDVLPQTLFKILLLYSFWWSQRLRIWNHENRSEIQTSLFPVQLLQPFNRVLLVSGDLAMLLKKIFTWNFAKKMRRKTKRWRS